MSGRPRLSTLNLWVRHEEMVLSIFREALQLLRNDLPESQAETDLNRALYLKVVTVTYDRIRAGLCPASISPPIPDSPNPPSPTTEGSSAESKRPDFLWGYIDSAAPDPERSVRNLAIECKRLGGTLASGWDLNRNYVRHGIARFVDSGHSYGKDAGSGAMIGYVQDMSESEILDVVNDEAAAHQLPGLTMQDPPTAGLTEMRHLLNRSFAPTDFSLHHLWVGLQIEVEVAQLPSNSPQGN